MQKKWSVAKGLLRYKRLVNRVLGVYFESELFAPTFLFKLDNGYMAILFYYYWYQIFDFKLVPYNNIAIKPFNNL